MTERHLKFILMGMGLSTCDKTFSELYAPTFKVHKMTKENFLNLNKSSFCFDWFSRGFEFMSGEVSCTGVEIIFTNPWFERISVRPMYDYKTGNLYNSVLAIPQYTRADWEGKKKISQSAHIIRNDKQLDNYFKKLFEKFECPMLS